MLSASTMATSTPGPEVGDKRSLDPNNSKSNSKRAKAVSKFTFTYPSSSGPPPPDLVRKCYSERKSSSGPTSSIKSVIVSDVISAVASHEGSALKEVQKKAQRDKSEEGKSLCETGRLVVKACESKCLKAVEARRVGMEANAKNGEKVVGDLERLLRKVKAEERQWLQAEKDCQEKAEMEAQADNDEKDDDDDVSSSQSQQSLFSSSSSAASKAKKIDAIEEEAQMLLASIPDVDNLVNAVSEDITLQADRIGKVLRKCKTLIGESEESRREVFHLFAGKGGVQFKGYEKVDDAKSLIKNMIMG